MSPTLSIVIITRDEPGLPAVLDALAGQTDDRCEVIVVDASAEPAVRADAHVIPFRGPPGVRVTIPHQRNAGVRAAKGEVVVFLDASCVPEPHWLERLTEPILAGRENVTVGLTVSPPGREGLYDEGLRNAGPYLEEAPTLNLAFRRELFTGLGGFDEGFAYGSDVDFTWRLRDRGERLRSVPGAVAVHDWGDARRQARRSFAYGAARARLYRKHRARRAGLWRREPMVVAYPLFLLGLPLTFVFPLYPLLLLVPAWRHRHAGVRRTLADHLLYGAGVLSELTRR